jgi:bifunctional DNase/RNase
MPQLIEVTIDSIQAVVNKRQYYVVVLKEQSRDRYLHIWTGPCEGALIETYRKGNQHGRPLAFDLMKTLVDIGGLHIDHIAITDVKGQLFFGTISVNRDDTGSEPIEIDCRPSDAINLAIRLEVPIFASFDVMDKAGKPSREVISSKLPKKLKQRSVLVSVLVWALLGGVLSWEPGGANHLSQLILYVPVGALLGTLQGLVDSVVVRAISTAILLSVVWGARFGWIGAIAGAVLGGLVEAVIRRLGKVVFSATRHDTDATAGESS